MINNLPIGVFDSGVGGITVLKALQARMPHENFVYLADTARLPYGEKTPDQIRSYFKDVMGWMKNHPVKMLVVACNTSSSLALENLAMTSFPIIGTIQPTVNQVALTHKRLGVIATTATVQSRAFEKALKKANPDIIIHSVPCPKLVPLIESYNLSSPETRSALQEYLQPLIDHDIHGLIYGCTHYPHLSSLVKTLLPEGVMIINPAEHMATEACSLLQKNSLLKTEVNSKTLFYTTGDPKIFQSSLKMFYGEVTTIEHIGF